MSKLTMTNLTPLIASLIALAANANSAGEGLPPSSSWNVDYAETECRLSRTFGTGTEMFTFRITRGANLKSIEYAVASKSLKIIDSNYSVTLRLDPTGMTYKMPLLWYRLPSGEGALRFVGDEAFKPDEIALARTFSLELNGLKPIRLAVGNMQKPMTALDACYGDLLIAWGINPAQIQGLKKTVQPIDINSWWVFRPGWAREAAKDKSWMTARLDVSEAGKATYCKVLASSGSAELDARVCTLALKNARLSPAISASGEKVAAPFVFNIQMRN